MIKVFYDNNLRIQMGENEYKISGDFSWRTTANIIYKAIDEIS